MPAPYYLLIPNGPKRGAPVIAHATLEEASTEAKRLHALFKGKLLVRLLETTCDFDPTHFGSDEKPIPIIKYRCKRKFENKEEMLSA